MLGDYAVYFENEYIRALVILVAVFLLVRALIVIIGQVLPKLTAKTKTKADDLILGKISGPITWIAMIYGFNFIIGQLSIFAPFLGILDRILYTVIIFFGASLTYHILDSIITISFGEFSRKSKIKLDDSLAQFFESIVKILVVVAAFLFILSTWGIEIGPLLAGLGVAGIAIAFALQSTLANVFGGISMLLDKSIGVGDLIELEDGTAGKIMKINLRSTKLQTFDNELIIVPNAKLADSNIQNVALPEPMSRVVIPFGVAYGSDVEQVKKLVLSEVKKIKGIVKEKSPHVKFMEMADSALSFNAYFYIDTFDNRLGAKDEANTRIYNALNKAGIEIPFPQIDVHKR